MNLTSSLLINSVEQLFSLVESMVVDNAVSSAYIVNLKMLLDTLMSFT